MTRTAAIFALVLLAGSCTTSPRPPAELHEQTNSETNSNAPSFVETVEAEFEAIAHVGDPHRLHWAKLDEGRVELSCVDGRASEELLGTPGGDAGELILLLASAEAEGVAIDADQVPALIDAWIVEFGGFYLHTDTHALAELGRALAADPRFTTELASLTNAAGELELADLEAWLRSPPPALREPLLAHLVNPNTVGCGHLSAMLRAPQDYATRPALIGAVIVGFYRKLWSAPEQLRFVVLHGLHHEHAILDLEVDLEADRSGEIPLIRPSSAHEQMFVIQPQAIAVVRERAAALLAEHHPDIDAAAVIQRMQSLGPTQLAATIAHLGVHVPTIRVVVDHAGARSITALAPPP